MADPTTFIIVLTISIFVTFLLGFILLASLLRQFRCLRLEQAQLIIPVSPTPASEVVLDEWQVLQNAVPLPEVVSFPAGNTASNAAARTVEPAEGSTHEQRNVKKLISFLKQESLQPGVVSKAS